MVKLHCENGFPYDFNSQMLKGFLSCSCKSDHKSCSFFFFSFLFFDEHCRRLNRMFERKLQRCDLKTTAQGPKTAKKFERGSHGSNVFSVTIFPLDLGIDNMPL